MDRRNRIVKALVGVLVPTALLTVGVLAAAEREGVTLDNFRTPKTHLTLTGGSDLSELEEMIRDAGLEVEEIQEDALGVQAGPLRFVVSKPANTVRHAHDPAASENLYKNRLSRFTNRTFPKVRTA